MQFEVDELHERAKILTRGHIIQLSSISNVSERRVQSLQLHYHIREHNLQQHVTGHMIFSHTHSLNIAMTSTCHVH